MLILARALMGIGGAGIYPTHAVDPHQHRSTTTASGRGRSASGPACPASASPSARSPAGCCWSTSGGARCSWSTCRSASPAIVARPLLRADDATRPRRHALDPFGAVFSIVGLIGLLFAIIEVPRPRLDVADPVVSPASPSASSSSARSPGGRRTTSHPMLDLRFFQNPRFSAASATITLTFFALYGSTFLLTQYFQFVLGYSPLKAGMLTAPVAIGIMATAPQAPQAGGADRHQAGRRRRPADRGRRPAALLGRAGHVVVRSAALSSGCCSASAWASSWRRPPSRSWARCRRPRPACGSAVNDTTRQTGGALGVAVIGSMFAARRGHGQRLCGSARHPHRRVFLAGRSADAAFLQWRDAFRWRPRCQGPTHPGTLGLRHRCIRLGQQPHRARRHQLPLRERPGFPVGSEYPNSSREP